MNFKGFLLAVFGSLCLSLIWLWMHPYEEMEVEGVVPAVLPVGNTAENDDFLAQILSHNLWDENRGRLETAESRKLAALEGESDMAAEISTDQSWALVGVSRQGLESIVVIESVAGISNYHLGDELPNGDKIIEIMSFGIQVSRLGKNENIYLFGKK